eukprot:5020258-Amphidinium_carterae.1
MDQNTWHIDRNEHGTFWTYQFAWACKKSTPISNRIKHQTSAENKRAIKTKPSEDCKSYDCVMPFHPHSLPNWHMIEKDANNTT